MHKRSIFQINFVLVIIIPFSDITAYADSVTTLNDSDRLPCIPREFGEGSIVCVCNSTYCDHLKQLGPIPKDSFVQIISSKDGQRFEVHEGKVTKEQATGQDESGKSTLIVQLSVNRSEKFQRIIGFGGAFTDAAGINIASVSSSLQKIIVQSYYSDVGLNYNIGRIAMGGSDFSTHAYSYDDVVADFKLNHFALTEEDLKFKIPFIKEALSLRPDLKLLSAPWSAPKWMKTNNDFIGHGSLKPEYYQIWAEYFVRFLQEYGKHNLTMWAVSTQNEPINGQIPFFPFNCMGWTAGEQRDWIKYNLGPELTKAGYGGVKVIILDDQRPILNSWIKTILSDPDAAKHVAGIGLHWYMDIFPASMLDKAHSDFPEYFLLATEASTGFVFGEDAVILGSWERAESYAEDIIEDLNHWVTGWIDWNLALDMKGGPNWVNNFVDAPVIVDSVTDVIYKQPMYYSLGHFSKFIPENSVRISTTSSEKLRGFETLTVLRPDGLITVVVLNKLEESVLLHIKQSDSDSNGHIAVEVGPKSIQSIIF